MAPVVRLIPLRARSRTANRARSARERALTRCKRVVSGCVIAARNQALSMASPEHEDEKMCRVCWGDEDDGPLVRPCACRGSAEWIHKACLEEWRRTGPREDAAYRCGQCKDEYRDALSIELLSARLQAKRTNGQSIVFTLDTLALELKVQGKCDEAEPLLREALEVARAEFGDRHLQTLTVTSNLGMVLKAKGDLAAAEALFREALEVMRETLGDRHKDTLASINNLGMLLKDTDDLAAAEPLLREALDGERKTLGNRHPNTLTSMNNLAALLSDKGDLAAAEPLYREAVEVGRQTHGVRHLYTRTVTNGLAVLLEEKNCARTQKWVATFWVKRAELVVVREEVRVTHDELYAYLQETNRVILAGNKRAMDDEQRAVHLVLLRAHEKRCVLAADVHALMEKCVEARTEELENWRRPAVAHTEALETWRQLGLERSSLTTWTLPDDTEEVALRNLNKIAALEKQLDDKKGELRIAAEALKVIQVGKRAAKQSAEQRTIIAEQRAKHNKQLALMRMYGNPRAIVAEQRAMLMRAKHDEQRAMHDAHLEHHEMKRVLKKEVRELKKKIKEFKVRADDLEEEEERLRLEEEDTRKCILRWGDGSLDLAGVEASLAQVMATRVLFKRMIETRKEQLEGKEGDLRMVATAIKVIRLELS